MPMRVMVMSTSANVNAVFFIFICLTFLFLFAAIIISYFAARGKLLKNIRIRQKVVAYYIQ